MRSYCLLWCFYGLAAWLTIAFAIHQLLTAQRYLLALQLLIFSLSAIPIAAFLWLPGSPNTPQIPRNQSYQAAISASIGIVFLVPAFIINQLMIFLMKIPDRFLG